MLEINQNQFWKHFHHMFDGWNTFREMTCVNWYSIRINSKKFRIPLFPHYAIIRKELCRIPLFPHYAIIRKELCWIDDMCSIWSGRKKSGKAKLCRSICLVMKIFWKISTDVVWLFKKLSIMPKSFKKKRPNSAKTLKELCDIGDMVFHFAWSKKNW